jgi:hypothetical protein
VGIVSGNWLKLGLGSILIIYSSLGLMNKKLRFKPTAANCIIGGVFSVDLLAVAVL